MNIKIALLLGFVAIGILYVLYLFVFIRSSKQVYIMDVDEFEKQMTATKEALLIDVRTSREFKKYHIEGAKNIDFLSYDFKKEIKKLDKSRPVMVYCHSGYRSKMVLPVFRRAGFKNLYELDGGFMSWLKAGKPVEQQGFEKF